MKLFLQTILCGIITFNVCFAESCDDEEIAGQELYSEEYCEEMAQPRQYVVHFVPYFPEGDALREKREESRWPGKRTFSLFDRVSQ